MKITTDKIKILGSLLGESNPLPMFRNPERTAPCAFDDTFTEQDKKLFGYETGFRVLPYKMQDKYSRERREVELKTITLENEKMKAVFLPDYGARLISLEEKQTGRELLFKNSVFQAANLSVRDAWFSGGIEWNIGQFGHSVLTCEPLFASKMTDDMGNEFLRVYEYERNRKIYFSIDFHLPSGSEQLSAHVRIVNNNDFGIPMYWWTNIAIKENNNVRIFSDTDEVLYIKPESNITEGSVHQFGRGSIKNLPSLPDKDPSYPLNFDYSSEYFFQNPSTCISPWEAAVYDDGFTFFERSTSKLQYRKMFCWGNHRGGRNWCDYLSEPGKGDYLEIQAGLSPSQIHGKTMPGKTTWEFTQIFGYISVDSRKTSYNWEKSKSYVLEEIDRVLPQEVVNERYDSFTSFAKIKPETICHMGSGWGALEEKRDAGSVPPGFFFPKSSLGNDQKLWLDLLETGKLKEKDQLRGSSSWLVDPAWQVLIEKAAHKEPENPWPLIYLGVLLFENDQSEKAVELWQKSIAIKATPIAWRNMAMALKDWGEIEQSIDALKRAVALEGSHPEIYLTRELMYLLLEQGKYNEAWKYYSSLPLHLKNEERIIALAAQVAYERKDDDFLIDVFGRSFAYIKEGETRLVDLWYAWQTRLLAKKKGIPVNDELKASVRSSVAPPRNIDFTMSERDKK